jgi:hypothetical protein
MANGGPERHNSFPAFPPPRDSDEPTLNLFNETTLGGQPAQIWILRKQLSVAMKARLPNGIQPGKLVGRATTEFLVVNSSNIRILSIRGATQARRALHASLFAFAKNNGLNVLPSERMDEATKQWLTDTGLPDRSTPDI